MTDFQINAKTRTDTPKQTRRDGLVPAVIYGKNFQNTSLAIEKTALARLYKEAGTSNLVDLVLDDGKSEKTLIHDVQHDPMTEEITHIDFYKVNMKEKIHAEIPLSFIGDSKAVIENEGTLITPKDSIEVECLPADLIPELEIDITVLDDFEKDIRVSDLKLPEGIEVLDDPDEVIAHVEEPRSDEELAELETEVKEDVDAVEVEHAGEAEGEAAEGGAAEEEKKDDKPAE